jgi:UDP-3-O-[3-hydroxymyristoyl] glucosamine N-acyltransferase
MNTHIYRRIGIWTLAALVYALPLLAVCIVLPPLVTTVTGATASEWGLILVTINFAIFAAQLLLHDPLKLLWLGAKTHGPDVDRTARIHPSALVLPRAVVEGWTRIGRESFIGPETRIGTGVRIGDNVLIDYGAQISPYARIDDDARIGAHARIGANCHVHAGVTVEIGTRIGENVDVSA